MDHRLQLIRHQIGSLLLNQDYLVILILLKMVKNIGKLVRIIVIVFMSHTRQLYRLRLHLH